MIEGRWPYKIDKKGRIPIPPELREYFGREAVVVIEPPHGPVMIFTVNNWGKRRKVALKREGSLQQFTLAWKPQTEKLDSLQGRISLPEEHRKLLRKMVIVVSIIEDGYWYLKLINNEEDRSSLSENPENQAPLEPFQSAEEAEEYLSKGEEVVYMGNDGKKVVGKFISVGGGFFNFRGKDKNGIIISLRQAPYWEFSPNKQKGRQ